MRDKAIVYKKRKEKVYVSQEDFQKVLQYAYFVVARYWRSYSNEYLSISLDHRDLLQEARLVVLSMWKKYRNKKNSIALFAQAVSWKMNILRRDAIHYEKNKEVLEAYANNQNYPIKKPLTYDGKTLFNKSFRFEDIKKYVTKEEYKLLQERFIEDIPGIKSKFKGGKRCYRNRIIKNALIKLRKKFKSQS